MGIGILFLLITFKGRQPALLCTVRFINSKGSIILLIGLDDRDSSPVNVIFNPFDANSPVSNLTPVPELPKYNFFLVF